MARIRTTKTVAKRHDLQYFAKPHPWRRARRALVFLCAAGAIAFVAAFADPGRAGRMHNPGHLTAAHATFENDCAKCHAGDGHGGFLRNVTDTACVQCHDASIHHPNQATFVSADGMRSTNCVACHTEHRGHEFLSGRSDQHCTQCHANLDGNHAVKTAPPPGVWTTVTAFNVADHPHFGRSLVAPAGATPVAWEKGSAGGSWALKSGAYVDPTVLRFNHKTHNALIRPLPGEATNCTVCHSTGPVQGHVLSNDPNADPSPQPPYLTVADAWTSSSTKTFRPPPVNQTNTADRRYTHQVSYERDCMGCHRLDLRTADGKGLIPIPHAEMALVRAKILSLSNDELNGIFPVPAAEAPAAPGGKEKKDEKKAPDADNPFGDADSPTTSHAAPARVILASADDDPFGGGGDAGGAGAAKGGAAGGGGAGVKSVTQDKLDKWAKVVRGTGSDQLKLLTKAIYAAAADPKQPIDRRALLFYVVYAAGNNSCYKCHETSGDVTAGFPPTTMPSEPAAATTTGAAAVAAFETVPTGIPAGPRRWFVNADFNHDAHRDMSCLDCHAKAESSQLTSDVLSPDIAGQLESPSGPKVPTNHATRSCVECHRPDTAESRGAGVNCVTCHSYHDRTLDHPTKANSAASVAVK